MRSVAVTGGGSGIGQGIARAFAATGHPVHLGDISAGRLAESERSILDDGGTVTTHVLDVTDLAAMEAFASAADVDGDGLGVFVNCAGVFDGYAGIEETSPALWRRIIE